VVQIRHEHPVFRRHRYFQGRPIRGGDLKDLAWLSPEGREMNDHEWAQEFARCLGVYFAGEALEETDRRGRSLRDSNFLLLLNAHHEMIPFVLPDFRSDTIWQSLVDTAYEEGLPGWVAAHREAMVVPDVFADGRILAADWFRQHGLRSAYLVPIVHQTAFLGVLALNGRAPFDLAPDGRFALSGSWDHTLRLWELDWEFELNQPADWDEGALPFLTTFLILHTPYADGLVRRGKPTLAAIPLACVPLPAPGGPSRIRFIIAASPP
jgi:GAF domain-containing protein